jgi:hypothetical protein
MGCGCGKRSRAVGQKVVPAPTPETVTASTAARSTRSARRGWVVDCPGGTSSSEPITSLLQANRAAAKCGGRARPA